VYQAGLRNCYNWAGARATTGGKDPTIVEVGRLNNYVESRDAAAQAARGKQAPNKPVAPAPAINGPPAGPVVSPSERGFASGLDFSPSMRAQAEKENDAMFQKARDEIKKLDSQNRR